MIAYWIYALLQAVVVISLYKVTGDTKRMVSLGFFALIAPIVTAWLTYIGMSKLLNWLQA